VSEPGVECASSKRSFLTPTWYSPMTSTEPSLTKTTKPWLSRIFRRLLTALKFLVLFVLYTWATLAIYYSNLPGAWSRLTLAVAFSAFSVWALWLTRNRRMRWVSAGTFLVVLIWFVSIPSSHDRPWRREVAIMPRAIIDGDRVRLSSVRNFDYRSRDDFTEHYEEREVSLSHLTSVDLYISYWVEGPVGHTFLSFNFDNAAPVCISIETRPEEGEGFAPVASLFKQFELIYVVGDERDLVRSRTNYRNEDVFLYPLKTPPEAARRLFLVYLERINHLADHPEWYHLLKNSCGINIFRYKNASGREGPFDIRHLVNGWADRYLYEAGMVDTSLPFEELRLRSHINLVSQATPGDMGAREFSHRIRESLPGERHKSSPAMTDSNSK
jgi:hypothetical protein